MVFRRILFVRSDRLGEFILSLPAIKLVKVNYPSSLVFCLAKKENIELVRDVDFIDYFLEYKEDTFKGIGGSFRLANIIRRERIDCIVLLNPKKEFHFSAFLAGIPIRVGYSRKWSWCLNKKIEDRKYLEEKHEVEYNIDLVRLICKKIEIPNIDLPVDAPNTLEFLKEKLDLGKKYIVLHPFTSHVAKKIEKKFWVFLVKKIKEHLSYPLALIGVKEEIEESKLLERQLLNQSCKVFNIVGELSIRNLAVFLKYNCCAFIGLDSGPMHLASLLNVPVVGLFKATNPKRWGPYKTVSLTIQEKSIEGFIDKIDNILNFVHKVIN